MRFWGHRCDMPIGASYVRYPDCAPPTTHFIRTPTRLSHKCYLLLLWLFHRSLLDDPAQRPVQLLSSIAAPVALIRCAVIQFLSRKMVRLMFLGVGATLLGFSCRADAWGGGKKKDVREEECA